MGIAELINKEKKTAFSFEVLPPLKGTGIEKLYATIDTLREFDPLSVSYTHLEDELHHPIDTHSSIILSRHIELLLDYCTRYYAVSYTHLPQAWEIEIIRSKRLSHKDVRA